MNPLADFSVVLGGPLYRLYRRLGLSGESLEFLRRRSMAVALFAWLPLLLLAVIDGNAWNGVAQAFLPDVDVHARLLVALPLLLGAELHVHGRMRGSMPQFVDRGIVTDAARPQFDAALDSVRRLRESQARGALVARARLRRRYRRRLAPSRVARRGHLVSHGRRRRYADYARGLVVCGRESAAVPVHDLSLVRAPRLVGVVSVESVAVGPLANSRRIPTRAAGSAF